MSFMKRMLILALAVILAILSAGAGLAELGGTWEKARYDFYVYDEYGRPINGATVNYASSVKTTNEKGYVRFDNVITVQPAISVSCEGYLTWHNDQATWKKDPSGFETIILYSSDVSGLALGSAEYSNFSSMTVSRDILTTLKKVSIGNGKPYVSDLDNGNFYLACKAVDPSVAVSYEIWQNEKKVATSSNGFFKLNVDSFVEGKGCFIRVKDASGVRYRDTKVNLQFCLCPINPKFSLKLINRDAVKFTVPDKIPYLGGSTIDFQLPIELPITAEISEDKYMIGFNVKAYDNKEDNRTALKKTHDMFRKVKASFKYLPLFDKLDAKQMKIFDSLAETKNNGCSFIGKDKIKVSVLGYAEMDIGEEKVLKGELMLAFSADVFGFQYNTWCVVVPVTVQVGLNVTANLIGEIDYNFTTEKLGGSLTLAPKMTLNAFAGVGVGKFVGVGVYGMAILDASIPILPDLYLDSLALTGELGIKAYIGWLSYKKAFAHNTWYIYNSGKNLSGEDGRSLLAGLFDPDAYERADWSYLDEESDWLGDKPQTTQKLLGDGDGDGEEAPPSKNEFNEIITNTYRNARPVMVAAGDKLYAAFLHADKDSGRVAVMLSSFDGSTWVRSVAADSEAVFDDAPVLCVDKHGKIWLTYARTAPDFNSESLSDYAAKQSIVVGTVDPDTLAFTQTACYTTGGYAKMQNLTLVDGEAVLSWVDTPVTDDASVLWSGTTDVYTADCNGNMEKVATVDKAVFGLTVGDDGGQPTIALLVDKDSSSMTSGDYDLYQLSEDGDLKLLQEDCAGTVTYGTVPGTDEPCFIWNDSGCIRTSNGDVIPAEGVSGEYAIVGDSIYYSAAGDTGAELSVLTRDGEEWNRTVQLTDEGGYLENLNVVELGGEVYVMGMHTNVEFTAGDAASGTEDSFEDRKDLVWMTVSEVCDIAVTDVWVVDEEDLRDYLPVRAGIEVTNEGNSTVNGLNVYLNDEVIYSYEGTIEPGQSVELEFEALDRPPVIYTEYNFKVTPADMTDDRMDNNLGQFVLGYSDPKVSAMIQTIGGIDRVVVCVSNGNIGKSKGEIRFMKEDGTVLMTDSYPRIDNETTYMMYYTPDLKDFNEPEATIIIEVVPDSSENDSDLFNNSVTKRLSFSDAELPRNYDMVLPEKLRTIGAEAFEGGSFETVYIPYGASSIGSNAFADCVRLSKIRIPGSVETIADDAFGSLKGIVIFCPEESAARTFAEDHGFAWIAD